MSLPLEVFVQSLLSINRIKALDILDQLQKDWSPLEISEGLIVPALEQIGEAWEKGKAALAQVYMSGRICEEYMNLRFPLIDSGEIGKPNIAIAVLEDYHKLGKRVVKTMLRSSGYSILDYGTLSVKELVYKAIDDNIRILLISTLMLPSALHIKELTQKLKKQSPFIKIVVGGAPFRFDSQLWQEVNADAVGLNGSEAVSIVSKMMAQV